MTDLETEMRCAPSRQAFAALSGLGVSPTAVGELGASQSGASIAQGRIEALSDGFYQPRQDGVPALLIAVCEASTGFSEDITDIIAIRSQNPSRWWWRVGAASMLGAGLVEHDVGRSILVVPTPIEWLANAGKAVCILDWSERSPVWTKLRHGPPLSFKDDTLREKVRRALIATAPIPKLEKQVA